MHVTATPNYQYDPSDCGNSHNPGWLLLIDPKDNSRILKLLTCYIIASRNTFFSAPSSFPAINIKMKMPPNPTQTLKIGGCMNHRACRALVSRNTPGGTAWRVCVRERKEPAAN